jgi:hypothetical protein
MALINNFTTQLSDVEKLKQLAKQLGYVQTRGPQKGEGSVRQLLEAMIAGEVAVSPAPRRRRLPKTSPEARLDSAMDRLVAAGLISQRARKTGRLSPFRPIQVEGEPVSKMVIRERR